MYHKYFSKDNLFLLLKKLKNKLYDKKEIDGIIYQLKYDANIYGCICSNKIIVNEYIGKIELFAHRVVDLPNGWYFANGDRYLLSSTQGQTLYHLPNNYKTDWNITITGVSPNETINVPNMFHTDGRGKYIRPVNGIARQVGSTIDDQMRNITGYIAYVQGATSPQLIPASGAFKSTLIGSWGITGSGGGACQLDFNSSNLGNNFNGSDTHPLDVGMIPAIFLGV